MAATEAESSPGESKEQPLQPLREQREGFRGAVLLPAPLPTHGFPPPQSPGMSSWTRCLHGGHSSCALSPWLNKLGFLQSSALGSLQHHGCVGTGLTAIPELCPSSPECSCAHNRPSVPQAQKETLSQKAIGSVREYSSWRHGLSQPCPQCVPAHVLFSRCYSSRRTRTSPYSLH